MTDELTNDILVYRDDRCTNNDILVYRDDG